MALPTFISCTRCSFEIDATHLPPDLVQDGAPKLCGRCGSPMVVVSLWPALLAMSVTSFDSRLGMTQRRGAA